jgi:hypothetical protein
MAVTVKKITLWRTEVENRPGILANVLEPLANLGIDLQVVMGYRFPGNEKKAALELYPVTGRKATAAAQSVGLTQSSIPTLLVEGDNRPGLGYEISRALADAEINLGFLVTQVIGRKYSAVIGFDNEEDARKATAMLKKVTTAARSAKGAKGSKTKSKSKSAKK